MKNIVFIQQSTLSNLAGRIDYIGSEDRQENLYATYDTAPEGFWRDLARENQADFLKNGTTGRCIEAREFIIALPPELDRYQKDELLRFFTNGYREKYGVECIAALHHNKKKNNLHIHMIYSERKELPEPEIKIATRNRFYDPDGKHVRTKKEATDDKGDLLPGYTMIPKGEVYETHRFQRKDPKFKSKAFLNEAKEFFSQMMNTQLSERSQMQVFPKNSPYMATRKIGKNNPRAAEIMAANELKAEWNRQMIRAQASGVPRESMMKVKKRLITDPVRESRARAGGKSDPPAFQRIIAGAIKVVSIMLKRSERYPKEKWLDAWGKALNEFMDFCIERAAGIDRDVKRERSRAR